MAFPGEAVGGFETFWAGLNLGCACSLLLPPRDRYKLSSLAFSQQCKPHKRPVCGSNGKTYLNHCELHRDACLTGSKIQVDYDGHCKGNPVSGSSKDQLL